MLNKLRDRVGEINAKNGFHEGELKSMAHYAGLIMTELGEAVDAERKGKETNQKGFEERLKLLKESRNEIYYDLLPIPEGYSTDDVDFVNTYRNYLKDTKSQELVGAMVRILDTAYLLGIDLDSLMEYELRNNSLRAFKHDKQY